ncbi:MAG: DUF4340 domain-containing protein [Snowella sp.]|nr:DUF4340 domain-containing protein [Snowella sp.]
MKLQKVTWILLAIAIMLGGGLAVYESQRNPQQTEAAKFQQKRLFSFKADDIQSLTIDNAGQILKFYRGSDTKQTWKLDQPDPVEANDSAISFLINLLMDSQSDRAFSAPSEQLAEYGLSPAQKSIVVQLKNGKTHQLIFGNPDFKGDFLYTLINPDKPLPSEVSIALVSRTFQELINRDPNEWKKADNDPKVAPPSPEPSVQP